MTDAVHAAIESQAAALATISRDAGYHTDIGARLIWPDTPANEDREEWLYRAGPISFVQVRPDFTRVEITWAAIVTCDPRAIDERALMVQSDLMRALRSLCVQALVARLPIPERESGSSFIVVAVSCTVGVPEPDLV